MDKKWKDMTIPEKIGTLIGWAIVIAILVSAISAFISGELTIMGLFSTIANFFVNAFLWIFLGAIALIVIVCCFPGVIVVLIGAAILLVVMLVAALLMAIF